MSRYIVTVYEILDDIGCKTCVPAYFEVYIPGIYVQQWRQRGQDLPGPLLRCNISQRDVRANVFFTMNGMYIWVILFPVRVGGASQMSLLSFCRHRLPRHTIN